MWYLWGRRRIHTGFLMGQPEGKRAVGRPRCGWENPTIMDLTETG